MARLLAAHGRKRFDASLRRARKNHERWLEAIRRLSSGEGATHRAALCDALRFGALEQNDWRLLSLGGLETLPIEIARELARHRGALLLGGVQSLSDEAASELSAHAGLLALDGLTSLSRAAAAALASCSRWKPDWILACSSLQFTGLETLSPVVAAELAAFDGDLNFSGVTDLPTPVAAALASHRPTNVAQRTLVLDGLKHLSVAAACCSRARRFTSSPTPDACEQDGYARCTDRTSAEPPNWAMTICFACPAELALTVT